MKYLSDSGAINVDFRVDYGETFYRKFRILNGNLIITSSHEVKTIPINYDGSINNWIYFDAELLIWYSKQDKILENFNFTDANLVVSGNELIIDSNLTIPKGIYKYHFMIETPTGRKMILIKGNFIYKREY